MTLTLIFTSNYVKQVHSNHINKPTPAYIELKDVTQLFDFVVNDFDAKKSVRYSWMFLVTELVAIGTQCMAILLANCKVTSGFWFTWFLCRNWPLIIPAHCTFIHQGSNIALQWKDQSKWRVWRWSFWGMIKLHFLFFYSGFVVKPTENYFLLHCFTVKSKLTASMCHRK